MGTESNGKLNLKTDRSDVLSKINLREMRKEEKTRKESFPYYTSFLPSPPVCYDWGGRMTLFFRIPAQTG